MRTAGESWTKTGNGFGGGEVSARTNRAVPEHDEAAAACRACEGAGPFRARPVRQKGSSSSRMIAISVGGSGVS